jgi:hypothetical protein
MSKAKKAPAKKGGEDGTCRPTDGAAAAGTSVQAIYIAYRTMCALAVVADDVDYNDNLRQNYKKACT